MSNDMETFYSPDGNPEIWLVKPDGYFTEAEWLELHPVPQETPMTLEELKAYALELLKLRRSEEELIGTIIDMGNNEKILFPTNLKNEVRINSIVETFRDNPTLVINDWQVSGTTYVVMTKALAEKVKEAIFTHVNLMISTERTKQNEILAMTSTDDLTIWIDTQLNKNWPSTTPR